MLYEKLKNYFVDDLIDANNKVIFVLESPHIQEVKNGYPVAGKSGIDMSKVLFNLDEAFGKLIFEKKITNIGIVNICNYPLQMSAYEDSHKIEKKMEFFEKIRQNPKKRKKENPINLVIDEMMQNFKSRLLVHADKKIIICGNFARSSFDSVLSDDNFKGIIRVPHPSFNNWKKQKYKDTIKNLVEFIK